VERDQLELLGIVRIGRRPEHDSRPEQPVRSQDLESEIVGARLAFVVDDRTGTKMSLIYIEEDVRDGVRDGEPQRERDESAPMDDHRALGHDRYDLIYAFWQVMSDHDRTRASRV
jgi:hypothetical protein